MDPVQAVVRPDHVAIMFGRSMDSVNQVVNSSEAQLAGVAYQAFQIAMSANPARAGMRAAVTLTGDQVLDALVIQPGALYLNATAYETTQDAFRRERDTELADNYNRLNSSQSGYAFGLGAIAGIAPSPSRPRATPPPAPPRTAPTLSSTSTGPTTRRPADKKTDKPDDDYDLDCTTCFVAGTRVHTPSGTVMIGR